MFVWVSEVAGLLGISRGKAYQLINSGELRSVKIGGCRRVRVDDLREYLDRLAPEVDECPV